MLRLIFMTLLRDLARFNVSNCNVVAYNHVYLLSYSVELFVLAAEHLLLQRHLCVQSNAAAYQVARPSVFRHLTGPVSRRRAGAVWWERDEQGLEGDTPVCTRSARPSTSPVSEMTYTVSSGTLNPTIPYPSPILTGHEIRASL